jgi:hypothetical protein
MKRMNEMFPIIPFPQMHSSLMDALYELNVLFQLSLAEMAILSANDPLQIVDMLHLLIVM